MILLDKFHYLILLALTVFALALYIKLYSNVKSNRYSIMGVYYFLLFSVTYPFVISNEIYNKRRAMTRKILADKNLKAEQKDRMKKFINSKPRLYFVFTVTHLLEFPLFIESFSKVYLKWYNEKLASSKNKHHTDGSSPIQEIKKLGTDNFPNLFKSTKHRLT